MTAKPSQTTRLYALLRDGRAHRTDEILERVYGSNHLGVARIGARIADIKQRYHVNVFGWHDPDNHALYWYRLVPRQPAPVMPPAFEEPAKVETTQANSLF